MLIERFIEVYKKSDEEHIASFRLNIDANKIIQVLDDLDVYPEDNKNEIYFCYFLTKEQVEKLSPYLEKQIDSIDTQNNIYELNCYDVS